MNKRFLIVSILQIIFAVGLAVYCFVEESSDIFSLSFYGAVTMTLLEELKGNKDTNEKEQE